MNLKQMKYVRTLAELGSFSGAAEVLQISQPSLSQTIKKVEEELGTELFKRTSGRVQITDAGRVYLETCDKMLRLQSNMFNQIRDINNDCAGTISIGASPFRCVTVMPNVVRKFQEKYPQIQLVIYEMPTKELQEAAELGQFDFCLTTLPIDEGKFCYDVVLEEEVGVAVKKGSKLEKRLLENLSDGDRIDVSMLSGEPFVMLLEHLSMQKELDNICNRNGLILKKAAVVNSLSTQLEMVAAGVGSSLVPMGIQKSVQRQRDIRCFSFLQEFPKRILVLSYPKERYLTKPMQTLRDIFQTI